MKPDQKDWDLFFRDDRDGLYTCFHLFYDDFYRLGLYWGGDPDLVKEGIHNLFLELWGMWGNSAKIDNKKSYVLTIYRRVYFRTKKSYEVSDALESLTDSDNLIDFYEDSYEELLIASQTEAHQKEVLRVALSKLTPRQKEIVQLRYFENQSFESIAQMTGLTERTVYNTLHNAIKELRKYVGVMWLLWYQHLPADTNGYSYWGMNLKDLTTTTTSFPSEGAKLSNNHKFM